MLEKTITLPASTSAKIKKGDAVMLVTEISEDGTITQVADKVPGKIKRIKITRNGIYLPWLDKKKLTRQNLNGRLISM